MERQKQLTDKQVCILHIIDRKEELRGVLDDSNEWLYESALESYAYDENDVNKELAVLKYLEYVSDNNEITAKGSYYLQQELQNVTSESKKKVTNGKDVIKLTTEVVALLTAILSLLYLVCSALKQ